MLDECSLPVGFYLVPASRLYYACARVSVREGRYAGNQYASSAPSSSSSLTDEAWPSGPIQSRTDAMRKGLSPARRAFGPKEHSSSAATVLGRLRPGPTPPSWRLPVSPFSVAVLAGCVSLVPAWAAAAAGGGGVGACGVEQSAWASIETVSGTRRWICWRPYRVKLSSLVSLSSDGLSLQFYSYAQAPARGGGDDGDRFTSSLFILSVSARNEARGTCVSELWCEDVDTPATVSRCASQPRLSSKHVGFRHYFEASVLFCTSGT